MNWFFWRPVHAGFGTYAEVCERWTLEDVYESHDALDEIEAKQREQMKRAR